MAPSKRTWPLGKGFERYHGLMGGERDQYYPVLVYGNHQVERPYPPAEGYHLSVDLADKAIEFSRDLKVALSRQPFFMLRSSCTSARARRIRSSVGVGFASRYSSNRWVCVRCWFSAKR
jgi:arylsulfatase A-like enzyme